MKKERTPIPRSKSSFILVQCTNCGNEQTVFSSTTIDVRCKVCQGLLAKKSGGKAKIGGIIIRRMD